MLLIDSKKRVALKPSRVFESPSIIRDLELSMKTALISNTNVKGLHEELKEGGRYKVVIGKD